VPGALRAKQAPIRDPLPNCVHEPTTTAAERLTLDATRHHAAVRPKGDAIEDCKQHKTFGKLVVLPIT
jgi:hypothetical protein